MLINFEINKIYNLFFTAVIKVVYLFLNKFKIIYDKNAINKKFARKNWRKRNT